MLCKHIAGTPSQLKVPEQWEPKLSIERLVLVILSLVKKILVRGHAHKLRSKREGGKTARTTA